MENDKGALKSFFQENLDSDQADDRLLEHLVQHISLKEGTTPLSEEERGTSYLREHTDRSVSGKQIDAYNIIELSLHDLFDSHLDLLDMATLEGKDGMNIAIAIMKLISKFAKAVTYTYQKIDAKILLTMKRLDKEFFTIQEVLQEYMAYFGEELDQDQLKRTMSLFHRKDMLRASNDNRYRLKEKVVIRRDY